MQKSASLRSPSGEHGVLVQSIGSATLTSAAAVAKGLGISAAEVVNCLYKAPAVLIDKVERTIAEQLTRLLTDIGYEVTVIDGSAAPPAAALFDVALYLKDADQLPQAAQKLAAFMGLTEQDATKMLLQPPGMALGSVSTATVEAFRRFMGGTVELVAAAQSGALFDIFLGDCPAVVQKRLLDDLAAAGLTLTGSRGLIATGAPRSQIDPVWQRHKTNGALRIIHQDFLRFDITLPHPPCTPVDARQGRLLEEVVGIPRDRVAEVLAGAPVTLLESVPSRDVPSLLEALTAADLPVAAELITFQALGLKITRAASIQAANEVLSAFGLAHVLKRVPETLPDAYPEIQSRVIRSALERAGATVELVKNCEVADNRRISEK